MSIIPRIRSSSPATHAPTPIFVPDLAIDPGSGHTRRIRRVVGVTRNVATVATAVPFMPLPARVAAGAVTGVAAVVDAALRPMTERAAATVRPAPSDDEILHDPALFAADAASALTTGVMAAGRAITDGARSPALRRTLKVGAVVGVVVAVGALGYRLVVGPTLRRRRQRRHDAMALIVMPDVIEPPQPAAGPAPAAEPAPGAEPTPSAQPAADGPAPASPADASACPEAD